MLTTTVATCGFPSSPACSQWEIRGTNSPSDRVTPAAANSLRMKDARKVSVDEQEAAEEGCIGCLVLRAGGQARGPHARSSTLKAASECHRYIYIYIYNIYIYIIYILMFGFNNLFKSINMPF
jgi:hypothetical protein